jgi:hypothetical protein
MLGMSLFAPAARDPDPNPKIFRIGLHLPRFLLVLANTVRW